MRSILSLLGILFAVGAAGAGALIVLPAPSKTLALAAIVASERSAFLVAAAVVALGIALVLRGVGSPFIASVIALLSVSAIALGLIPLVQARQVAQARGVPLDLKRYLHAQTRHRGAGAPRPDGPLRHRRRRTGAVARRLPAVAPAGDAEPPAAGGARRILGGGPARRGVARQPGAGRSRATPCSTWSIGSPRSPTGGPRSAT